MANYPAQRVVGSPRARRERGFTLIESMGATLVLVVGMMAVYSAEAGATRVHGNSKQLFRATQIASNMLQVCNVFEPGDLSAMVSSSFSQAFDVTGKPTDRGSAQAMFQLALTQGAASSTANNVLVTVSWHTGSRQVPQKLQWTGMFPK